VDAIAHRDLGCELLEPFDSEQLGADGLISWT